MIVEIQGSFLDSEMSDALNGNMVCVTLATHSCLITIISIFKKLRVLNEAIRQEVFFTGKKGLIM